MKANCRARRLTLQQLERRELLAGNVDVAYTDSVLRIEADSLSNRLVIETNPPRTTGAASVVITPGDAATVLRENGAPVDRLEFELRDRDQVFVSMGAGSDALTIVAADDERASLPRDVDILMGDGRDSILFSAPLARDLNISTGGGHDHISIAGATIGRDLTISTASGKDTIQLGSTASSGDEAVEVMRHLKITTGGGDDVLNAHRVEVEGKISIRTGGGEDRVALSSTGRPGDATPNLPRELQIDTGAKGDEVQLTEVGSRSAAVISTGAGGDQLEVRDSNFYADLAIRTAGGVDTATVEGSTIEGDLRVADDVVVSSSTVQGADVVWTHQGDGYWDQAEHWSSRAIPRDGETVLLPSGRRVTLRGGVLKNMSLRGGASAQLLTGSSVTLDGVTLAVDLSLTDGAHVTVFNDLVLADSTIRLSRLDPSESDESDVWLDFSGGDQVLGGTGSVELYSQVASEGVRLSSSDRGKLTIDAGVTMRSVPGSKFAVVGNGSLDVVNKGTISAEGDTVLSVRGLVLNEGHLHARSGSLDLLQLEGNLGHASISPGAGILASSSRGFTIDQPLTVPADSDLRLVGDWTALSTIHQTGGDVSIRESILKAEMLTAFTGEAGSVFVSSSTIDDPGAVLMIDAARRWVFGSDCELVGVTIDGEQGAAVEFSSVTLDGVTLAADAMVRGGASVTVKNGLVLDQSTLRLEQSHHSAFDVDVTFPGGSQLLGGNGIVEFFSRLQSSDPAIVRIRPTDGGHLTIGSGIIVRNDPSSQFAWLGTSNLPLTIEGSIVSQSPQGTLRISASPFTNTGVLRSVSGELLVSRVHGSLGRVDIVDGELAVDGIYTIDQPITVPAGTLTLEGRMTNASTIHQTGGTINVWQGVTVASLGTFTGSRGSVVLRGGFDDPGATLAIGDGRSWRIESGRLRGVTIEGNPETWLHLTRPGAELDDVTLSVNTVVHTGAQVLVRDDLTLDSVRLRLQRLGNSSQAFYDVGMNFLSGDQTIQGAGVVELYSELQSSSFDRAPKIWSSSGSLTIGAGIAVRNSPYSRLASLGDPRFPLIINGAVIAESQTGWALQVTGSEVINNGVLQSLTGALEVHQPGGKLGSVSIGSGRLSVFGSYTIDQPVQVAGGRLTLHGNWSNASTIHQTGGTIMLHDAFTVADLGSFTGTGGDVRIAGELNDPGGTLLIDETRNWQIDSGQLVGVAVRGSAQASLKLRGSTTLDAVTLGIDIEQRDGAQARVKNGLTLDSATIRMDRTSNDERNAFDVGLNFHGDQTLGGNGQIIMRSLLETSIARAVRIRPTQGTLTIGPGITVSDTLDSKFSTIGFETLPLILLGTILSNGDELRVRGASVTNRGTLEASAGPLEFDGSVVNEGTITARAGQIVRIQGDFVQAATGTLHVELGGSPASQIGRIRMTAVASLAGTLRVSLASDFQPALGETFGVVSYASRTEEFDLIVADGFDPGLALDVTYYEGTVEIRVVDA